MKLNFCKNHVKHFMCRQLFFRFSLPCHLNLDVIALQDTGRKKTKSVFVLKPFERVYSVARHPFSSCLPFFVRCWEKRAKVTSIMKTRNSDVWHTNLTDLLSQSARSHKLNINPEISVRLKVLRWHFSEECVYGAAHNHFLLCSASSTFRHLFIFIWYSIYKVRSIFIPKIYTKSHE